MSVVAIFNRCWTGETRRARAPMRSCSKLLLVMMIGGASGIGCGPSYVVVQQAKSNVLFQQRSFSVETIDFSPIPDASSEEQQAIQEEFEKKLNKVAGDLTFGAQGALRIESRMDFLGRGATGAMVQAEADGRLLLVVWIKRGDEIIDELKIRSSVPGGYSDIQRLRDCAKKLGRTLAHYLQERADKPLSP